jgi:hypothetical protein
LNIFQGTAKIRTKNIRYEGPADLYASPTAIYINYEDNWLRWDTERSWEAGRTEHYRGNGDLGNLSVHIIDNAQISFDALAIGNGVYFKGEVKY